MKGLIISQYNGQELSFNEHGWFNATQAASKFNKSVHEWVRLPDTQKYMEALMRKYGKIPYLKTKRGNNGGTWLHPKLAVRFAQWLDIDFALWCDEQIDHLLRGSHPIFDKRRLRHQAAATYKAVSAVLQLSRQQQGKETKPHHYINEARLINWAITGQFTGLDRDSLSYNELDLLAELEAQDLILIGCQCTYEQRKTALNLFAQNFKANRRVLGCSEVLEAEA
ncbi:KilA-N domain-containing protein [Acinetobacter baumannii]|uniref:KilA-N domain-containing protein n=1 Tax=Acinetobacter baumannii TaxID=470 RepID=UPI001FF0E88B|nr:KilA-N domain-containing protein [Acinetobacter baumannii]MCJ9444355.1 KilA-N domain-containing protein [Acinetobacter baumannii]MCT9353778.1 KilA-N domain-containing protein [Acinetobacter baumannii]HCG3427099.1 KilA-N domain-containing protein [Acinetobacter baumannii]